MWINHYKKLNQYRMNEELKNRKANHLKYVDKDDN